MKLVVPSRTQIVAAQIREATRRGLPVVFAGPTMGGGPPTRAMLAHLEAGLAFAATATAAATFADDLDWAVERGVRLCDDDEARRPPRGGAVPVRSGDLDLPGLLGALAALGAPTELSAAASPPRTTASTRRLEPRPSLRRGERALAGRPPLE